MLRDCEFLAQTGERTTGFTRAAVVGMDRVPNQRTNRIGSALVALADTPLASRFCSWRGLSGRRYVFSVYPPSDCPAFCNAVLLAAVSDDAGGRRMVSVRETGLLPEPIVARMERELRVYGGRLEFHLHLLGSSPAKREAALSDLAIDSA